MKRGYWASILSLYPVFYSRRWNSSSNGDNATNKCSSDETVAQHLVLSLGFKMREMESLVQSFSTGHKPALSSARGGDRTATFSVTDTCMGQPMLLILLKKVTSACCLMFDHLACDGGGHATAPTDVGRKELDDMLHRCVSHLKLRIGVWNKEYSSAAHMQLGALNLLAAVLRESVRAFRQEGKRRFQACSGGNAGELARLHEWRYKVLCSYVEAVVALDDASRATFAKPLENSFSVPKDIYDWRERSCLSASKIVAVTLLVVDELLWHALRPSVRSHGGEEVMLLEGRIKSSRSSILQVASILFERVVEESVLLIDDVGRQQQQPQRLLSRVLRGIENILTVVETREAPVEKCHPDEARIFCSLILWLLLVTSAISSSLLIQLELERKLISSFQRLWLRIAPPLERHATDKVMTHRTLHSSLNIRYARCRYGQQEGDSGVLLNLHPSMANLLLGLLVRTARIFSLWHSKRDTAAPVSMVVPYAVLCRTLLEIETELYFLACRKTGQCWVIPIDISSRMSNGKRKIVEIDPAWANVLCTASDVRVSTSSLIRLYASAYVSEDIAVCVSTDGREVLPFVQCSTCRFLSGIAVSFFPLMRRHYLATEGKEVLTCCLHTFLALKQVSDVRDGDGEERRHGDKTAFRVCGVSLSQATEVGFFLSLQRQASQSSCDGFEGVNDQIEDSAVSSYVKEILFALDHNTAKQLWHLRTKKMHYCFTGVQCEEVPANEPLRRREANSILAVIHAHVLHPSFLWMPLQQLQEVVFILSQNRELIKMVQPGLRSSDLDALASSNIVRVGSLGGTLRHFSRALGYVALRLYVVSNVLRYYYQLLLKREKPASLPLEDSASEKRKCSRRLWARNMALILRDSCSGVPAEMEGLDPRQLAHRKEANLRVLGRLQATIRLAARHSLLFHVKKERQARRRKLMVQPAWNETKVKHPAAKNDVAPDAPLTTTSPGEVLTLHLERVDANLPLGFSLHGDRATIRRVTGVSSSDSAGTHEPTMPFTRALRAAGVSDFRNIVGWRVLRVDGEVVENSSAVILLVEGKCAFSMTLCST